MHEGELNDEDIILTELTTRRVQRHVHLFGLGPFMDPLCWNIVDQKAYV